MKYVTAVLAALGLLMLGTVSAQADEGPFTLDTTGECGTTIISTTAESGTLVVQADGEDVKTAPIGTPIQVGPFVGDVEVHYRVFGGGERDNDVPLWNGHPSVSDNTNEQMKTAINAYIDAEGDEWVLAGPGDPNPFVTWESVTVEGCTEIEAQAPTATQAVCDDPATLTVPVLEDVIYSDESGDVTSLPQTVTVTAEAADGFVLVGDAEWELTFSAAQGCAGEPGGSGDQGEPGKPGADGSDGKDGSDAKPAAEPTAIPAGSELPKTGGPGLLALGGAVLTAAGGGLLALRRKLGW